MEPPEQDGRPDWTTWANTVVLVEGGSDAAAVHALARRRGRDLRAEGLHVLSAEGVTNFARLLLLVATAHPHIATVGLYDEAEERHVVRALQRSGSGSVATRADVEARGFSVCLVDLEDELIRALGVESVEQALAAEGELSSFRRFQRMPQQRDRDHARQLRRFLGTRSMRKIRYGRVLVEALDLDRVPHPLDRVFALTAPSPDKPANG